MNNRQEKIQALRELIVVTKMASSKFIMARSDIIELLTAVTDTIEGMIKEIQMLESHNKELIGRIQELSTAEVQQQKVITKIVYRGKV